MIIKHLSIMKKFILKLKSQIYEEPIMGLVSLILCFVILLFGIVGSISLLVKTFMLMLSNVPTIKII